MSRCSRTFGERCDFQEAMVQILWGGGLGCGHCVARMLLLQDRRKKLGCSPQPLEPPESPRKPLLTIEKAILPLSSSELGQYTPGASNSPYTNVTDSSCSHH